MQVFYGKTGFAGDNPDRVVPAILVDDVPVNLRPGDHVTIWDRTGEILFAGPVIQIPEYTRIQVPLGNPRTFSPAVAEGKEVQHFLNLNRGQLGFPEWYQLFFDPEEDFTTYNRYLRARLICGLPGMPSLYERISEVYWTPPKLPRFAFKVGFTYALCETGTEGIIWVIDGGQSPYDFHELREGDVIVVWNKRWLFTRLIVPDFRVTSLEGWRIHWLPCGVTPDRWGELFFKRLVLPDGGTRFSWEDANLPALAFTFPPLSGVAKVLQRMLTGPPRS